MRRSLSTKILYGYLIVVIIFSLGLGFFTYRMQSVRSQLELINAGYLRLTLILGELHTIEGNLLNTIAERTAGRGVSKFLQRQVSLARQWRLYDVERALRVARKMKSYQQAASDHEFSRSISKTLNRLKVNFKKHERAFDLVFSQEFVSRDSADKEKFKTNSIGESLLRKEREMLLSIRKLSKKLRSRVKSAATRVEDDQQQMIFFGVVAVIGGLLISAFVALRMQRALKPLGGLVGGTKRIASGDYSQRVAVESADELASLAIEFNRMAEAIEEREQRLIRSEQLALAGRLASHITHEVRNPLNSISLNTELLEEELSELPENARSESIALLRAVQREVDRLTGITEEYLQFARLPKPNLDEDNLAEIIRSLTSFIAIELDKEAIELKLELEEVALVLVDENQLRQALLNIIRNAKEAMATLGGGLLHIQMQLIDDELIIYIRDNGPGIRADALEHVFDPFFSTKQGGTGLGLALTQQIINEHDGKIKIESSTAKEDHGTVFVITFPTTLFVDSKISKNSDLD